MAEELYSIPQNPKRPPKESLRISKTFPNEMTSNKSIPQSQSYKMLCSRNIFAWFSLYFYVVLEFFCTVLVIFLHKPKTFSQICFLT